MTAKTKTRAMLKILIFLLLLATINITVTSAIVTELYAHPEVVVQGAEVSISGKASPNEVVWIDSASVLSLPVSDGRYNREFKDIYFPKGKKVFSMTAEKIEDIRLSITPVLWMGTVDYPLDGPRGATNGTAALSLSFPIQGVDLSGEKDIKVYGAAEDSATSVILRFAMTIQVTADSNGDFSSVIDTGGFPLGELLISASEKERTVHIVSTEPSVFDTGSGIYPSIPGTHHGKIIPAQPVFVHKLYTYPCIGTGGHSERITISNASGWTQTAMWDGYNEERHNIYFADSFDLRPDVEYNYTLETSSYPQIIHKSQLNTNAGTITCEKFVDVNGKVYKDWIPAIILS
ncbi:MAG: hypothetical protein U9R10_03425 [Euryarchaeota archaeon]|nr:hypothetical protein [Euryarchaeota archaeon]